MGRSYTVHCVGIPFGLAMSRLEIIQEERKAALRGEAISYWFAQTTVGERILGCERPAGVRMEDIPELPKVVVCPICQGEGHNGRYHCPVCNGSGVCKAGNEKKWLPWQLERMWANRKS